MLLGKCVSAFVIRDSKDVLLSLVDRKLAKRIIHPDLLDWQYVLGVSAVSRYQRFECTS